MTGEQLGKMRADGIDPDKIRKACDHFFYYLGKEDFSLLDMEYLMDGIIHVMKGIMKDNILRRRIGELNCPSAIEVTFAHELPDILKREACRMNNDIEALLTGSYRHTVRW